VYLILFTIPIISANAEVYRWEENGKVLYSDKPNRKAKKIKLNGISTYKSRRINPRFTAPDRQVRKDISKTYQVSVLSPGSKQTLYINNGNVSVRFGVSPRIDTAAGHKIQYSITNTGLSGTTAEMELEFKSMDRGEHTVIAKIVDSSGRVLSSEVKSVFYLRRHSILHP